MPHRVRAVREPPAPALRDAAAVEDADYTDTFQVPVAGGPAGAEQWARRTLEEGPVAFRWFLTAGWRWVLRMQLGPRPSADHVQGWEIAHASAETVVLAVRSAVLGPARLVFRTDGELLQVATVLRYDQPGARHIWAVAGLLHRRVLPYAISSAVRRVAR